MSKRLGLALAFLLLAAGAQAEPLEVAAFGNAVTPSASIKNALSAALVSDQTYGVELSYERSLSRHWALRLFAETRSHGYYAGPDTRRSGGGLGLRAYWFSAQPLAGLFLDTHFAAFRVSEPFYRYPQNETLVHTMFGGGLTSGWAIPIADHVRLTPAYRIDWLFSDQEKSISGGGGHIYGDLLIYLAIAF